MYTPCIINIDNDGKTERHDFDDAGGVYGKAVLTIDEPDKIEFKTTKLWNPNYDDTELEEFRNGLKNLGY